MRNLTNYYVLIVFLSSVAFQLQGKDNFLVTIKPEKFQLIGFKLQGYYIENVKIASNLLQNPVGKIYRPAEDVDDKNILLNKKIETQIFRYFEIIKHTKALNEEDQPLTLYIDEINLKQYNGAVANYFGMVRLRYVLNGEEILNTRIRNHYYDGSKNTRHAENIIQILNQSLKVLSLNQNKENLTGNSSFREGKPYLFLTYEDFIQKRPYNVSVEKILLDEKKFKLNSIKFDDLIIKSSEFEDHFNPRLLKAFSGFYDGKDFYMRLINLNGSFSYTKVDLTGRYIAIAGIENTTNILIPVLFGLTGYIVTVAADLNARSAIYFLDTSNFDFGYLSNAALDEIVSKHPSTDKQFQLFGEEKYSNPQLWFDDINNKLNPDN